MFIGDGLPHSLALFGHILGVAFIVTGKCWTSRHLLPSGPKDFSFLKSLWTAFEGSFSVSAWNYCSWVKSPACECGHSPPPSADVTNVWSSTSTLIYAFLPCAGENLFYLNFPSGFFVVGEDKPKRSKVYVPAEALRSRRQDRMAAKSVSTYSWLLTWAAHNAPVSVNEVRASASLLSAVAKWPVWTWWQLRSLLGISPRMRVVANPSPN